MIIFGSSIAGLRSAGYLFIRGKDVVYIYIFSWNLISTLDVLPRSDVLNARRAINQVLQEKFTDSMGPTSDRKIDISQQEIEPCPMKLPSPIESSKGSLLTGFEPIVSLPEVGRVL